MSNTMSSETLEMGINDGKLCLQMGVDGKVLQLIWKNGDGKEQVFPQTTDVGKVQLVHTHDRDAIMAAKLAAKQNEMEFIRIVLGFKVIFSEGPFYFLLMLAKDGNGHCKVVFTIVETIYTPVVLLFTPLKLFSSETLETENDIADGKLSGQLGDGVAKVQYVDPNDDKAIAAATYAATHNGVETVEFDVIRLGFQITFPFLTFYHILFFAKDSNGESKLYFTAVAVPVLRMLKPWVMLFKPLKLSSSETLEMGNDEKLSLQMGAGSDGKVEFVGLNDHDAIEMGKLAAKENDQEFIAVGLGFKIIFPYGEFYHLMIFTKEVNSHHPKLIFTIVAKSITKPVVLLFTPVKWLV